MTDEIQLEIARAMRQELPKRYEACSFDNFEATTPQQEAAMKLAATFAAKVYTPEQQNLLLIGPPGTGKTHLAAAAIRCLLEILVEDLEVHELFAFTTIDRLARDWRIEKAGGASAEASFLRGRVEAHVLLLDDVVAPSTDGEARMLNELIDCRYWEEKAHIITSNLNLPELRKALGDRVFDRLREGAVLCVLDGESHRARYGWEGVPDEKET